MITSPLSGSEYDGFDPRVIPEAAAAFFYRPGAEGDALETFRILHPAERVLVEHAAPIRQADFGDARYCAHQALKALGRDDYSPILRGERGMPLWPHSVVGSMSHTKGLRGAVVAPRLMMRSMGLDIEVSQPLEASVIDSISSRKERQNLDVLRDHGIHNPETILFSAKEATYKAWFPVTRQWLGFDEAELDLHPDGTFVSYILLSPSPIPFIEGRWQLSDGFIISTTTVPSGRSRADVYPE